MYIAARRMKGVVSPQHAPTKRNPRIQRKMDGCGSSVRGGFGSIIDTTKLVSERKFRVYRIQKIVQVLSGHSMHAIGVVFAFLRHEAWTRAFRHNSRPSVCASTPENHRERALSTTRTINDSPSSQLDIAKASSSRLLIFAILRSRGRLEPL
jgi:hypothetical protein